MCTSNDEVDGVSVSLITGYLLLSDLNNLSNFSIASGPNLRCTWGIPEVYLRFLRFWYATVQRIIAKYASIRGIAKVPLVHSHTYLSDKVMLMRNTPAYTH